MCISDSLRGSSVKLGTIQRILAWPLRTDDTHTSISVNNTYMHMYVYIYIYIYIHILLVRVIVITPRSAPVQQPYTCSICIYYNKYHIYIYIY